MTSQPRSHTRRAERALFGSWLSALLACLAVFVPKCPLCAAAYLCLFGVSASSARDVAELGLPLCVALIAGSTLATALFVARRSRPLARRCCDRHRVHALTRDL
jgi:hypothetical protein